jgi:prepilin-type N-terminal cleavage/methylation domain-containing protein
VTIGRRWFEAVRARAHREERGFTMVEVMVAILIFGVLITGIATMQGTTLNLIRNNRNRSVAANLASQEMDTIRTTSFTSLPVGQTVTTRSVDGVPYTITRESEWVAKDATAGACDAPQGSEPAFLRITVSVTWNAMRGVEPPSTQTVVTPPVGTYDQSTGHLAVRVVDRDGAPASGVTIAIAGPQTASQTTSSDGCVFFAFLPPGSYTATASASGFVSDQFVASPQQPTTVTVAAISSLLFLYDGASSLSLTLTGKDVGSAPPTDVGVMLFNTHILPAGTKVFPGTGTTRTIPNLFPYADGYEVWAGTCADADPGGSATVAVEPGQSTSSTVGMPEVRVSVTTGGLPTEGAPVVASHTADAGCAAGESFAVGSTDAAGALTFALPYGTWAITVNGIPGGSVTLLGTDPPGPTDVVVAL